MDIRGGKESDQARDKIKYWTGFQLFGEVKDQEIDVDHKSS